QYGYWFNDFERSLAKIGYGVIFDGFYDSSEIDIIKRFQRDHGLDPDGLVGPLTWRAALPSSVCAPAADVSGESTCSDDWNDDGVYGPGDVVPH
ncbi:MAG: peptidoglycan-binding domain-containing protein, partial [Actinomycetota bacterium]